MTFPALLAVASRGPFDESRHFGHAVIANAKGEVIEAWGNPSKIILPRSSAKMLQALPLLESGAGKTLSSEQLALACASHSGEMRHVRRVEAWLETLGLDEHALCCGPQATRDRALRTSMIKADLAPSRLHNNCSGKHAGFLTLGQHLGAGPDYVQPDHPVQRLVRAAFEEMCGEESPGFGIDGCSAPNFACSLVGFATALARFATFERSAGARGDATVRLRNAMMLHPELVSGAGRCCSILMQACKGKAAIKTGAEGVFAAILPDLGLGVALKVEDGATRASEAAMAGLLVRLGVLDRNDPAAQRYIAAPISNWDGVHVGALRVAKEILA